MSPRWQSCKNELAYHARGGNGSSQQFTPLQLNLATWPHDRFKQATPPQKPFWGTAKSLSEAEMWDECDKTRSRLLLRSTSATRPRVGADSTFWPSWLLSIPSIPLHLPSHHGRGQAWLVLPRRWGSATRGQCCDAGKSSALGDPAALRSQHLHKSWLIHSRAYQ